MSQFLKTIFLNICLFYMTAAIAAGNSSSDNKAYYTASFIEDLHTAVRTGDITLYSIGMKYLLGSANIETFLQAMFSKDEAGNNIFHLMAGVKEPEARKFFASEMQTLFDFFTGTLKSETSLGGLQITIPPMSEDNVFLQAVKDLEKKEGEEGKKRGFSLTEERRAEEALSSLKQKPSIEFIKTLYARDDNGQTFLNRFAHHVGLLPAFSPSEQLVEKWHKMFNTLKSKLDLSIIYGKNKQGKTPLDIAYRTGNPEVYQVLKKFSSIKDWSADVLHLGFIGSGVGLVGIMVTALMLRDYTVGQYILDVMHSMGFGSALLVLGATVTTGGILSRTCYRLVKKQKDEKLLENSQ